MASGDATDNIEDLKRILEFKKKRNAPKDRPYVEKIEEYLREHRKKQNV